MSAAPGTTWRLTLTVADDALAFFESALEPHGLATQYFRDRDSDPWRLSVVLAEVPDRARFQALIGQLAQSAGTAPPDFSIEEVPPRDWVAETYRAFPPIETGRFFVHGSHFEGTPPGDKHALCIDAATAFGSGEHATTRGCLTALDDLAREDRTVRRVMDVGSGTGILAMAAACLWKVPVLATDIDPEAVRVARENVATNGLGDLVRVVEADGYAHPEIAAWKPCDLIVANILARPLCQMAGDLAAHLEPGGMAVISGFVDDDEDLLRDTHRKVGLDTFRSISVGEWRTLVLEKPLFGHRA